MPVTASPPDFVSQIDESLWQVLAVRDLERAEPPPGPGSDAIGLMLQVALHAELEAAEIAARWVESTSDLEVKLAFAQQAGDEAKHYALIEERLRELGQVPAPSEERSKLFRYLASLESSVERVAAAQFAREAVGYRCNEMFIAFCEAAGDEGTARLYRSQIQPDEWRHHEWGKRLLARLATTPAAQAAARAAILKTLETAAELRALAAGRLEVEAVPGC